MDLLDNKDVTPHKYQIVLETIYFNSRAFLNLRIKAILYRKSMKI